MWILHDGQAIPHGSPPSDITINWHPGRKLYAIVPEKIAYINTNACLNDILTPYSMRAVLHQLSNYWPRDCPHYIEQSNGRIRDWCGLFDCTAFGDPNIYGFKDVDILYAPPDLWKERCPAIRNTCSLCHRDSITEGIVAFNWFREVAGLDPNKFPMLIPDVQVDQYLVDFALFLRDNRNNWHWYVLEVDPECTHAGLNYALTITDKDKLLKKFAGLSSSAVNKFQVDFERQQTFFRQGYRIVRLISSLEPTDIWRHMREIVDLINTRGQTKRFELEKQTRYLSSVPLNIALVDELVQHWKRNRSFIGGKYKKGIDL